MKPPPRIYVFLVVGLIAASQSGNIIRIGDAPPVAIATWRLLLAALLFAPLAGRELAALRTLDRRGGTLLAALAVVLSAHFFSWIAAVQMTTVANAATVLALTPVFAALGARVFLGERVGVRLLLAILLGVSGVASIGLEDLGLRPEQVAGDLVALASAVLFAAYLVIGRRLNPLLPTRALVTGLYGVAAALSLVVLLALRLPVVDYGARNWLCFLLMALIPTGLGHTAFNAALRHLPAGWVSATTLSEPVLAGLVAWIAWDEPVTAWGVVGYGLIAASVLSLVRARPTSA